jgi:DUF971 family protein
MATPDCMVYVGGMRPADIQVIGDELAIRWEDNTESFVRLETLRRRCPCAGCQGERDVLGQLHKGPEKPYSPASFHLRQLVTIGSYALQPTWGDGHNTGIYAFDYLRQIATGAPG